MVFVNACFQTDDHSSPGTAANSKQGKSKHQEPFCVPSIHLFCAINFPPLCILIKKSSGLIFFVQSLVWLKRKKHQLCYLSVVKVCIHVFGTLCITISNVKNKVNI